MFISEVAQFGAGMAGLGLVAIGGFVLLAPVAASRGYGVPITSEDATAKAFAAGAGVRDIAAGAAILLVLATATAVPLGAVVLAATLIPLGDLYVLATHRSPFGPAYLVHGVGAALMLLVGVTLLLV